MLAYGAAQASDSAPYRVRYTTEAVLQHLDDLSGSELTLKYHSEEDYYFDDHEDEWYAAIIISSCYCGCCYCGFETHYDVERILYFGREHDDNPLRFSHNQHMLRRAVITTVKQAYNAGP